MKSRSRLFAICVAAACLGVCLAASAAQAARPAWAPLAVTTPTVLPPKQSEVQTIWIDAEAGTYKLTFNSQTTGTIAFNAPASTIETALNGLSSIGGSGGSVQVAKTSEGEEGTYVVTFGGSLANTDVAQMSTDSSGLSGGDTHSAAVSTKLPGGAGTTQLTLMAQNIGGFESVGNLTFKATLPEGVTTAGTFSGGSFFEGWSCTTATESGHVVITCLFTAFFGFIDPVVGPGHTPVSINGPITSAPGTPSGTIHAEITGGGAEPASTDLPLTISPTPAKPGLQVVQAGAYDSNGNLDTRAGAHPYSASARLYANTIRNVRGSVGPAGQFKDIVGELPPGFLGNPVAVPACPESIEPENCPLNTIVGNVQPMLGRSDQGSAVPLVNTVAPFGYPGKFRFNVAGIEALNAVGQLRSFEDYGLNVGSFNTPQLAPVFGTYFTFWGAPADPSHDTTRCHGLSIGSPTDCGPSDVANTAFLTNAVNCAEQAATQPVTRFYASTWQGDESRSSIDIPPVTGCDKLHFEADFKFEPSDTKSDSPASFRTELTVPSAGLTDPTKLVTPEIKESVVKLPEGVVLNASGADGLAACSLQQIGYLGNEFPMPNPMHFNADPNQCPDASKIGTGELTTALLEEPLQGALYLAAQGNGNPFGSLFAVYLVIEDPRHGIFIKLPGKVEADKQTGRMEVTFQNLPQLPFTNLRLTLKGGDRSAMASPTTCGTYVTDAINTPWSAPESGPPTTSSNGFEINQGPNGLPCAPTPQARPFDVGLKAGTAGTAAGQFSPLTFQITRPDGSQELNTLELSTAPGLSAKLKGIPQCSDGAIASASSKTGRQEQASSSCPSASQIGKVITGAGSGPTPFYSEGKLYLAGPYKGAPLSVVAITPAVAGPFDLGNVLVRTAVFINRSTAQVTAKSDPIPQILEGVPLRIKDVRVILDRQSFSLNPTSCDQTAISAHITGNSGASKDLSSRFQVGGCESLDFKPSFSAIVKGGTKRGSHPQFIADLSWPEGPGFANTRDFQVTLPHSEFLDQAHIRTICTRVQALADACPPGSIYGFAEAETPLLDGKLSGPVFLKSSDHKLPDLAIKLKGPDSMPVEVEFAGRIDSIHGQIRDTIEGLPDVPVSSFTLRMAGGKKGLLINSRNLCTTRKVRLDVNGTAQNNKPIHLRPILQNSCKAQRKAKRHHKRHKH